MAKYLNRYLAFWTGVLLLLGLSFQVEAHNRANGIAYPVKDMVIDGDFSDWPARITEHSICNLEEGDKPRNAEDFQGSFRIGYNSQENALYLAIAVRDQSVVPHPRKENQWWAVDGCRVSLDVRHQGEEASTVTFSLWGEKRQVEGTARLEDAQVAVRRRGQMSYYEWRIDIGRLSAGQVQLNPGMTLGFDLVAGDVDDDGSSSGMWWGSEGSVLGDVVLVGQGVELGSIRGRVKWRDRGKGVEGAIVEVRSSTSPALWTQTSTDWGGRFEIALPAGHYTVQVVWPGGGEGDVATVEAGSARAQELTLTTTSQPGQVIPAGSGHQVRAGTGHQAKAGRGQVVKAGGGYQRGLWHTLDPADGLPDPSVVSILQDRTGNLWFGTHQGVSRYDGATFTTFGEMDGLGMSQVYSLLEDNAGNLWFAPGNQSRTRQGVTRYDGTCFTRFSTADSLVHDDVITVAEDRRGNLWFGTWGGVSRYDGTSFTNFTMLDGLAGNGVFAILADKSDNLWFGTWGGVSRYDGTSFTNFTRRDGLADGRVVSILEDGSGHLWFGTRNGGVSRYDGKQFVNFTAADGLAQNWVTAMVADQEGHLWFGTGGANVGGDLVGKGVSRYDGRRFTTFTPEDGLAHGHVLALAVDRDGDLWAGTGGISLNGGVAGRGVSRYEGSQFTTFTTADGLPTDGVACIEEDRDGHLWVGTFRGISRFDGNRFNTVEIPGYDRQVWDIVQARDGSLWLATNSGVFHYDGKRFIHYTKEEGVSSNVASILEDSRGQLWVSGFTDTGQGLQVSRYDGKGFTPFALGDSLMSLFSRGVVGSIAEDRDGNIWFATNAGALRYDGENRRTFSTADGLPDDDVRFVVAGREGYMWFWTRKGICRFDGAHFVDFASTAGMVHDLVLDIMVDRQGQFWFSTWGGGVTRYDGRVFQRLLARDGLAHDGVQESLQDRNGDIWIATEGGLTRYRPRRTSPPIRITEVITDRTHGPVEQLSLPSSQTFLAFEFQGQSFKTRIGQMAYLYRLQGHDDQWQVTRDSRVIYENLPAGDYLFQVKAVDRDLNYSEGPAHVRVLIHPPYGVVALWSGFGITGGGLFIAIGYGIRRRRDQHRLERALMREMAEELQTAHDLQMGLMPKEPPRIEGFEITGRCTPANHVGGDLFQYFHQDRKLTIGLADVTGHAMEAAIPVVMFSGILENQMESEQPLEELFGKLNRSLNRILERHTFICFAMGELDLAQRTFRLSNSGCPYPYHYQAATSGVVELRVDAYPLGIRPDTRYPAIEVQLEPGDRVVFCSDGIIEAVNAQGELFGFERTSGLIRQGCHEGLSAEALLERLMGEVKTFRGGVPQGDDQTVVVVEVKS